MDEAGELTSRNEAAHFVADDVSAIIKESIDSVLLNTVYDQHRSGQVRTCALCLEGMEVGSEVRGCAAHPRRASGTGVNCTDFAMFEC